MATTQAVIPQMRLRGSGVIINVTSTVTFGPLLMLPVYTASKAAVEAFTASVALELKPFGVRAKLVEPGLCLTTAFGTNARPRMALLPPYEPMANAFFANFANHTGPSTTGADVAVACYRAATEDTEQVRFVAGADAIIAAQQLKTNVAKEIFV